LMLILWHTGSPNPFVVIPYDVLVTMGRSEDFPAKVEQHGDLPNSDYLRAGAMAPGEPAQLLATLEGGRSSGAAGGIGGTRGWSVPAPASVARGATLDSQEYPNLRGDNSRERMQTESDLNAHTANRSETVNTAPVTQEGEPTMSMDDFQGMDPAAMQLQMLFMANQMAKMTKELARM
jgi:hypothetical protein